VVEILPTTQEVAGSIPAQCLPALISAYFGLDSRECECLEYLFIYLFLFIRQKSSFPMSSYFELRHNYSNARYMLKNDWSFIIIE
jgi:hypothetical protein